MRVHRYFGPGFPEIAYKRALMIELEKAGVTFRQEVERDIIHETKLIYKRRLDIIVDNTILLELKTQKTVDNRDYNQIINYLRVFRLEVSLLLNFGASSLQFKRFVNTINNQ